MQFSEQEVVISRCADEKEVHIYSTIPSETRYYTALAEKVGGRVIPLSQGGTKFVLPKDRVRTRLVAKIILSDEEKARRSALARARFGHAPLSVEDELLDEDTLDE